MRIKLVIGICVLFVASSLVAQQEPQYTQYMYNPTVINPAYTGSQGYASAFALYRAQWVGIEGAPQTANIAYQHPFQTKNMALGFNMVNDRIGPTNLNYINVDFAYTLLFKNNTRLAMGLKAGVELLSIDYSRLSQYNPSDPLFQNSLVNQLSPNFGAGVYYYSKKWYVGASIPMLMQTDFYDNTSISSAKRRQNVYIMGGYVFDINPLLKFKPAVITKIVSGAPLQVDLTANFLYNNRFTIGTAYRHSAAVSLLFGVNATSNLFIGYGFDMETTKLMKYNGGSHEIFIKYDFHKNDQKIETPRFF
jgi:type IX secretion system PorP/SprF family membrane protein